MTTLECSGLVTLVKISNISKVKEKFITIPKGTDFASITDPTLYGEYIITRKALIVDVSTDVIGKKLNTEVPLRFINTHLSPYNTDIEQNRQLRTQQAEFICNEALKTKGKENWAWAILGMDMNDVPGNLHTNNSYIFIKAF